MSELVKTKAIVLNKINFGDTSKISNLFTEDFGKIPVIIKGARSSKSKIGFIVDSINYVEVVLYKKETREIQISSQIDLIKYYQNIREDFDKLTYANAIIELLNNLLLENEPHKKLFYGTVRIFELLNESNENPKFLFTKYFLFLLKEIGYEIQTEICNSCGKKIVNEASFNYEIGILCNECCQDRLTNFNFNSELIKLLVCLRAKKKCTYKEEDLDYLIIFFEKFLSYNIQEFKGIRSLKFK
ncbi:MAG: DNA repair protein RecO [Melioribacteraceae bacterium]|nr:DNA repair protein RecO [Melioribacteraceae bacterium]